MIATILQVTAISMVQATQESLDRPTPPPIRPTDDTVVITNVDPNLNATEDLNVVILENGETVRLVPENITQTEGDEIVYIKPLEDSTFGITEVDGKESSQALIRATRVIRQGSETGSTTRGLPSRLRSAPKWPIAT